MYTFVDHLNGESLTLRPEGTASCVRAVLAAQSAVQRAAAAVLHRPDVPARAPAEGALPAVPPGRRRGAGLSRPGRGCRAHRHVRRACGSSSDWTDIRLQINTLGSPEARARYRARLVKYLEQHLRAPGRGRPAGACTPIRCACWTARIRRCRQLIEGAPRLYDDLDEDSLKHFEDLQAILRALGLEYEINPRLVRGLDYYNHTVFEWVTDRLGAQAAVCAGGRYDGLIEQLGGKPAPACGFAMGVERLLALMGDAGTPAPPSAPDVYLVLSGAGVRRVGLAGGGAPARCRAEGRLALRRRQLQVADEAGRRERSALRRDRRRGRGRRRRRWRSSRCGN